MYSFFLADHEAVQFTYIHKIQRYLCADEAKGLLVPYMLVAVRRDPCVVKMACSLLAACSLGMAHWHAFLSLLFWLPLSIDMHDIDAGLIVAIMATESSARSTGRS